MTEERNTAAPETEESRNFILNLIDQDIAEGGQFQGQTVHTRFPPEPNGYLHIGHCKALCIDFGTAEKFGGLCNLRMDDTNPAKEDTEYVDAIQQDIHWLGFDWGDRFFYGSDYFEKDYEYAVELIKKGLAYVCELTPEEFKANRGDIGIPATSPYRDRPIEENLRLFEKMKNGEVEEGKMTLRAKIDLASGNLNLRDPIIYRIRFIHHHRAKQAALGQRKELQQQPAGCRLWGAKQHPLLARGQSRLHFTARFGAKPAMPDITPAMILTCPLHHLFRPQRLFNRQRHGGDNHQRQVPAG